MSDAQWCVGWKIPENNYALGVQKTMRVALKERGVSTHCMNADRMREVLSSHADFKNEKSRIERFLMEDKEYIAYMLPKFHCEFNPIECVWAQAKRYLKAYCTYSTRGLHNTIYPALGSVTLENVQNHSRKGRHYMFAYLGIPGGCGLDKLVKIMKTRFCHIRYKNFKTSVHLI